MRIRQRYRDWRRRRRRKSAVRRDRAPLREFVYLDDVSVYSLYASRKGPITTELTETEAASLQTEVTASTGLNAVVGKAEAGSRLQAGSSHGTQVLRKSIIQATFKELYDLERESLALHPLDHEAEPARYESAESLQRSLEAGGFESEYIIDPTSLRRGALVELEVQLEPEPIFHAGAVIGGVLDIIQDNPAMFGLENLADLATASAVNRMLEKLLAGLVPVRGRAIEYEVVELGDKEWIVHRRLLTQIDGAGGAETRPLFLTGVAEQALFWKDIRRVLFAGSSYRVLARLARDGLQATWTPVKLADVLRSIVPDVAVTLESANSGILAAMTGASTLDVDAVRSRVIRDALVSYGIGIAEAMGHSIAVQDIEAALADTQDPDSFRSVTSRRTAFAEVTRFVESRLGVQLDRAMAANCRTAALVESGFSFDGQTITPSSTAIAPGPQSGERFLDSELVAVYW